MDTDCNFAVRQTLEVPVVAREEIPTHIVYADPPVQAQLLRATIVAHFWPGPYRFKHHAPSQAAISRDRELQSEYLRLHNNMPFDEPCVYVGKCGGVNHMEVADAWGRAAIGCMYKRRPVEPMDSEWNTSAASIKEYCLTLCSNDIGAKVFHASIQARGSYTERLRDVTGRSDPFSTLSLVPAAELRPVEEATFRQFAENCEWHRLYGERVKLCGRNMWSLTDEKRFHGILYGVITIANEAMNNRIFKRSVRMSDYSFLPRHPCLDVVQYFTAMLLGETDTVPLLCASAHCQSWDELAVRAPDCVDGFRRLLVQAIGEQELRNFVKGTVSPACFAAFGDVSLPRWWRQDTGDLYCHCCLNFLDSGHMLPMSNLTGRDPSMLWTDGILGPKWEPVNVQWHLAHDGDTHDVECSHGAHSTMTHCLNRLELFTARAINLRARRTVDAAAHLANLHTAPPITDDNGAIVVSSSTVRRSKTVKPVHKPVHAAHDVTTDNKPVHCSARTRSHKSGLQLYHKIRCVRDRDLGIKYPFKKLSKQYWDIIKHDWDHTLTPDERAEYEDIVADEREEAKSHRIAVLADINTTSAHGGVVPIADGDATPAHTRVGTQHQLVPLDETHAVAPAHGQLVIINDTAVVTDGADQSMVLQIGDVSAAATPSATTNNIQPMSVAAYTAQRHRDLAVAEGNDALERVNAQGRAISTLRQHASVFNAECNRNIARARNIIPPVMAKPKPCSRYLCSHRCHPASFSIAAQLIDRCHKFTTELVKHTPLWKLAYGICIRVTPVSGPSRWHIGVPFRLIHANTAGVPTRTLQWLKLSLDTQPEPYEVPEAGGHTFHGTVIRRNFVKPEKDSLYTRGVTSDDIGRLAVYMDTEFMATVVTKLKPTLTAELFKCRLHWNVGPVRARCVQVHVHSCTPIKTFVASDKCSGGVCVPDHQFDFIKRTKRAPAPRMATPRTTVSMTRDPRRIARPDTWCGATVDDVNRLVPPGIVSADGPGLDVNIDEFTECLGRIIDETDDTPDITTISDLRRVYGKPVDVDNDVGDDTDDDCDDDNDELQHEPKPHGDRVHPPPVAHKAGTRGPATAQQFRPAAPQARESRGIDWGIRPWKIARMFRNLPDGVSKVHVGWGATCKLHSNSWDDVLIGPHGRPPVCKKALIFTDCTDKPTSMTSDEAELRIKHWLVAGLSIAEDDDSGRQDHLAINPRDLPLLDDSQLRDALP